MKFPHAEDSIPSGVFMNVVEAGEGRTRGERYKSAGKRTKLTSLGIDTKQFISKAPYLRGIPQVGLIEEVAYLLRSALQGLQVVAHLLMEIVGAFEG